MNFPPRSRGMRRDRNLLAGPLRRAVEYGTHVYRASRYSFELTFVER